MRTGINTEATNVRNSYGKREARDSTHWSSDYERGFGLAEGEHGGEDGGFG